MFSLRAQTVVLERDPDISDMVNAVSPENLQQLVEKLASFGTRHTLSDTLSDTRGIGAARRWIKAELERYARASGGRMRVEYDTYLREGGVRRVDDDTEMIGRASCRERVCQYV